MEPLSKAKLGIYRTLADRKMRQKHGLFIAEGAKLLHEALLSGWVPQAVVLAPGCAAATLPALPPATRVYAAQPHEFAALTQQPTPEGVLAVLPLPDYPPQDTHQPPLLPAFALHQVQDPGNLGTLLRTADWFGFGAVYASPGTVDAFNPKSVRAAMGAVFRVPVVPVPQFEAFVATHATQVLATALDAPPLGPTTARGRSLVLLGAESHGLPPHLLATQGIQPVCIPGRGGAESLNVAAAAAILAYCVAEQPFGPA
jgi:TrmH family RNA methyltransferase